MTNKENLLKVTEAAERLNVAPLTVYRAIKAGKIPAVRVGKLLRIRPADLEAYITAGKITPAQADTWTGAEPKPCKG